MRAYAQGSKWQAKINYYKSSCYLGSFSTREEAAYDEAVLLGPEWRPLNFLDMEAAAAAVEVVV